jgi:hypothetical protein
MISKIGKIIISVFLLALLSACELDEDFEYPEVCCQITDFTGEETETTYELLTTNVCKSSIPLYYATETVYSRCD